LKIPVTKRAGRVAQGEDPEFKLQNHKKKKPIKIEPPYDPEISLLGVYPKECTPEYNRATCTPMFIAALLTIAKLWKHP
jgi:hypothetical protein